MAHILVVDAEDAIREVLCVALRDEEHLVTTTSDAALALAALQLATIPLVVLLNERLCPLTGFELLTLAAQDTSGRLARHSYVLMTTNPEEVSHRNRTLLERLVAPLLPQPFDLDELSAVVTRAECQLHTRPLRRETRDRVAASAGKPASGVCVAPNTLLSITDKPRPVKAKALHVLTS